MRKVMDMGLLLDQLSIRHEVRGDTLWACCPHPAHDERTPSWRVNADAEHPKFGQHRCYGCGWGGWPIHLAEVVLGCSREDARAWLRDISQSPPLPFMVNVEYQRSYNPVFMLPPGCYLKPLAQWPLEPRNYVLNDRGIQEWQVDRWGIQYTVGRYDKLQNPLAGRIVFPVRDTGGRLIGYTGRSYTSDERRYKEPSKAEGADLGAVFGAEHWPKPKHRRVVAVAEGAINALAIERAYPYSLPIGALYGSQLAPGHVSRLSTFRCVLMVSDPDKAGNKVAAALRDALLRWVPVVRVEIPEGDDAASLAKRDPKALHDALGSALRVAQDHWHRRDVAHGPTPRRSRLEVRPPFERR